MENIKDYRVKITVRNNYLLTAMENAGIASLAELARRANRSAAAINGISSMRRAAFKKNGEWSPTLMDIAEVLGCPPGELVPPQHWEKALPFNSGEIEMGIEEVAGLLSSQYSQIEAIPDLRIERKEALALVRDSLGCLKPRERHIIRRFHGLDGDPSDSFADLARHYGISRSRVGMIYERGLRRLRGPARSGPLRVALESMFTTDV